MSAKAPLPRLGSRGFPAAVGGKAFRLHRALQAGLPVPDGALLSSEQLADCLSAEPAATAAELLHASLPETLRQQTLVVRSAFDVEDSDTGSFAGAFHSETRVDGGDADAVFVAVQRVAESARRHPVSRRDVLIQAQVNAAHAGVAFTEPDYPDDLVEWTDGLADGLVAGRVAGSRREIPKAVGRRPSDDLELPEFLGRLAGLLAAVRRRMGPGPWDIEWADDGERCWLVQLRPVVVSPGRDDVFTVANHKEILPELPSRLMTSVMAERAAELFGWYRNFDPGLPAGRPFLEVFRGRPRINLSLLAHTMERWGLPTRLVTASIGGGDDVLPSAPLRPLRMVRRAPALLRMAWAQQRAPAATARAARQIEARLANRSFTDFTGAIESFGASYVELVHGMFAATAAMSLPLALLRRWGALPAWSARHRTVTTDVLLSLQRLRSSLQPSAEDRSRLAAGELPAEPGAAAAVREFLERHAHRGPFESDVARPRFGERPESLLQALAVEPPVAAPATERPRLTPLQRLSWPLWRAARAPMAAREQLRDDAMRSFAALRSALLELAGGAVDRGLLPEREAVFDLSAAELRALDGPSARPVSAAFLAERRAEIAREAALPLPDLFFRRGLRSAQSEVASGSHLQGLGLTRGVVTGRVQVVHDPSEVAALSSSNGAGDGTDPLILVAPAVEAGWIPLFSRVDAVLVEIGGELSHGSIVLREAGLPAITDLRGACSRLGNGQRVRLDAALGVVELLDD